MGIDPANLSFCNCHAWQGPGYEHAQGQRQGAVTFSAAGSNTYFMSDSRMGRICGNSPSICSVQAACAA